MPRFAATAIAALIALSFLGPARADVIAVGNAEIAFTPPPGFCVLDTREDLDRSFIDVVGAGMGTDVHVLAAFADCVQLSVWRKGLISHLRDYGFLTTARNSLARTIRSPRADVVQLLARDIAQLADLDEATSAVRDRTETKTRVRLDNADHLGVLHVDADAVYFGIVARVITDGGQSRDALEVGGATLIKGKVLSYLLYGEFVGEASVHSMLAFQRNNVGSLIAAN